MGGLTRFMIIFINTTPYTGRFMVENKPSVYSERSVECARHKILGIDCMIIAMCSWRFVPWRERSCYGEPFVREDLMLLDQDGNALLIPHSSSKNFDPLQSFSVLTTIAGDGSK